MCVYTYMYVYIYIYMCVYIQVHLIKLECREKVIFSCNLFQKVKLSYILDSLHVKEHISKFFLF